MTRARVATALGLLLLLVSTAASGHELDTVYLSLTETGPGQFRVRWRATSPTLQKQLADPATFPPSCRLEATTLDCGPAGLVGPIEFPWLDGTLTRVMVEIEWLGHARLLRIVTASSPRLTVYGVPTSGGLRALKPIAADYTSLGVEHILTGFDHLLFVIALTLLVRSGRRLLATVTAFTVAHSLSLAATVLGLVNLPSAPVEATIALSIVLVCAECLREPAAASVTRQAPWIVAFAFGLLHGLGFASALLAIGLPEQHLSTALLFFNVGVELGQLGVIAVVVMLAALARRARVHRPWLRTTAIYAMGAIAASWSLERIAAVFSR